MALEQVFAATPAVGGGGKVIASPFQFLFTGEDKLRVVIMNSAANVTVQLDYRFLLEGRNSPQVSAPTFRPTANRQPNTFDVDVGIGYLLNCSLVVVGGAPLVGQTYVMVQIVRGSTGAILVVGCLLGGYVTAMQHLAYPGSPIESSISGGGYPRVLTGTTPAAGAEIAETVPAGARWVFRGLWSQLTTSAAINNRVLSLVHRSPGIISQFYEPQLITASSRIMVQWAGAMSDGLIGGTSARARVSVPADYPLLAGDVIGTYTESMDAADTWSTPTYVVNEYLEAA